MAAKASLILCFILSLRVGNADISDMANENDPVTSALNEGRIRDAHVDYSFEIESLEHLEELSELVVRGEILPASENVVVRPYESGYTLTKVKISEVYAGEAAEGDIITLYEPYFLTPIFDREGIMTQDYIITRAGYLPSKVGNEYILFLVKNTWFGGKRNGAYEMYNTIMGRYPVLTHSNVNLDAISNRELCLIEDAENTIKYRELYKDVLEKYQ